MKKQTQEKGRCSLKDPVVTYSSELLYHALVRSTDDFIYVCDMKIPLSRWQSLNCQGK